MFKYECRGASLLVRIHRVEARKVEPLQPQVAQLTHVRTSPHYPESNNKIERWHGTLKRDCIRVKTPLHLEQARQLVAEFIEHYNTVRWHRAIGYVTPKDRLENKHEEIFNTRYQKLEAAREKRKLKRQ